MDSDSVDEFVGKTVEEIEGTHDVEEVTPSVYMIHERKKNKELVGFYKTDKEGTIKKEITYMR